MNKNKCKFCNGNLEFIYKLNGYNIVQCQKCHTTTCATMPTKEELKKFYDGFKFCINEENKNKILNERFSNWFKSFNLPKNAKMLDLGGGGGFFSLSFEHYNYGKATYIDLDPQACEYVSNLGIHKVINDDICNLAKTTNEKFDFIYSRHVIEHVTNPIVLISAGINLLSDDGVFVLQCPNGMSFERLIDKKHYQNRKQQLEVSNKNLSQLRIFSILHSSKTSFGLDPIRHLWAISPIGIKLYLKTKNLHFRIKTYSIEDPIYSPYFEKENFLKAIARNFLSLFNGKAHLVIEIRKKPNENRKTNYIKKEFLYKLWSLQNCMSI